MVCGELVLTPEAMGLWDCEDRQTVAEVPDPRSPGVYSIRLDYALRAAEKS